MDCSLQPDLRRSPTARQDFLAPDIVRVVPALEKQNHGSKRTSSSTTKPPSYPTTTFSWRLACSLLHLTPVRFHWLEVCCRHISLLPWDWQAPEASLRLQPQVFAWYGRHSYWSSRPCSKLKGQAVLQCMRIWQGREWRSGRLQSEIVGVHFPFSNSLVVQSVRPAVTNPTTRHGANPLNLRLFSFLSVACFDFSVV